MQFILKEYCENSYGTLINMEQWDYLYNRTMGLSISYNDYNVNKQKRLNCFKNELLMENFMNGHFKSE